MVTRDLPDHTLGTKELDWRPVGRAPAGDRRRELESDGEADGLLVFEGFALLSVPDAIDTRTAGGRLVLNVLTSVAEWEREAISERTRIALAQVRASGVRLGPLPARAA
jgi:hypothetical protein